LSLVVDLTYGRRHWRLAQNQKQGSDLSMSYEDRVIALLRTKSDPRTASRGKMTRAEFVRMLVRSIKAYNIDFFCPELHKIQPIDSKKDKNERKKKKQPGLEKSTALTILGHTANKQQVDNAETILDIGYHMRANRKVLVAALMTAMDESTLINVQHGDAVGPDSIGVFQQRASWGPLSQRKTVAGASKLFFKVAIEIDKAHSDWTLWELCTAVQFPAYRSKPSGQIPSFGLRYDRFKKEAKVWVDEYGATGGDTSFTRTKRFQFTVGPPDGPDGENYWQAITRLAEEVNWRAFVHNNTFYYVPDDYLIRQKPEYTISEETEGIEAIDFDVDAGKKADEVTVTCRADRWTAPAGSVIRLEKCGPADGKWLVWDIERQIFSYDATITLHREQKRKPEPKADVVTVASDGSDAIVVGGKVVTGDAIRDRIVAAAKRAHSDIRRYHYTHWRPAGGVKWPSLFSPATYEHGMDCSAFVEMVFMAAGAQDPMGLDYRGGGYTTAQILNGRKTNQPNPGDLVFYGAGLGPAGAGPRPGHVAIFIGDGEVIEMGGNPGPRRLPVNYRGDIIGYYSYVLAKHNYAPLPTDPVGGNPGRIGVGDTPSKPGGKHTIVRAP
jgi:cell wall-associated NlpC family hydrolase